MKNLQVEKLDVYFVRIWTKVGPRSVLVCRTKYGSNRADAKIIAKRLLKKYPNCWAVVSKHVAVYKP